MLEKDLAYLVQYNQIKKQRLAQGPGVFPSVQNISEYLRDDEGISRFADSTLAHNSNLLMQAKQL